MLGSLGPPRSLGPVRPMYCLCIGICAYVLYYSVILHLTPKTIASATWHEVWPPTIITTVLVVILDTITYYWLLRKSYGKA